MSIHVTILANFLTGTVNWLVLGVQKTFISLYEKLENLHLVGYILVWSLLNILNEYIYIYIFIYIYIYIYVYIKHVQIKQ